MKKIYDFGLAMLLIGYCAVGSMAQITCQDSLTVVLTPLTPSVTITVEEVVTSSIPTGTTLDKSTFDCDDYYFPFLITAKSGEDECTAIVTVLDNVPPVAIVDLEVEITIPDGFSEILLNPQIIDNGSFDECSAVSLSVEPAIINCSDIGEIIDVTLSVTDLSGNTNSAITRINVKSDDSAPLECIVEIEIAVVEAYPSNIFTILQRPNDCAQRKVSIVDMDGNVFTGSELTMADLGKTFFATSTQPGDTCITKILVIELECDPFIVCDTECNGEDYGDCGSGHTDQDNVEWPCDITIDAEYPFFENTKPEDLISIYGIGEKDVEPQIMVGECHSIGSSFQDQIFHIDNAVKIIREWIIFEWRTGFVVTYSQEIVFLRGGMPTVWNICDTKDNTTDLGDCSSGHTSVDDVEWPADVSAVDHRILPKELLNISKVEGKDAQPVLLDNQDYYQVSFEDGVISSSASYSLVARKWKIQSTQSASLKAEYIQYITIPEIDQAANKVFVTTHGGRPMPGVLVNGSEATDYNGVVVVNSDDQVTLKYEDDPLQGLDVLDQILISQHILGFNKLPFNNTYAMDINSNGKISAQDILILQEIILERENNFNHTLGWNFIERSEPLTNVKADYLSFKKGDVDDSALLGDDIPSNLVDKLVVNDLILNEGEEYEIEISVNNQQEVFAGQWEYTLNSTIIEISDIRSDLFKNVNWFLKDGEALKLTMDTGSEPFKLDSENVLMKVKFRAKSNAILSEVFQLSYLAPSFFVSEDYEKIYLGGEVEGQITSGTKDVVDYRTIQVSPNPASSQITIRSAGSQDVYAEIFNANGQRVLSTDKREVDVTQLPSGIYFIQGIDADEHFKSRFIKL
jgi:hypothetical protein